MTRRRTKPKPVALVRTEAIDPVHHQGLTLAATLLESLGGFGIFGSGFGGLHGGMPAARQGGQDSPAIITEQQLQTYRGVARWAYEQNEYYGGLIDRLVDYTCGKGFTWKAGARRFKEKPGQDLPPHIQAAQDVIDDFRHADGWRSRQREAVKRLLRDGEYFLRLTAPTGPGLPQCRFVEPEHIVQPHGSLEWRFGILALRHDAERHLAYFVKADSDDVGEVVLAAGVRWQDIPGDCIAGLERGAGCIVHRKESRIDRAVKRGLPLFWGGTEGLQQAEVLIDNLTEMTAYLSTIAYFRQHAPGVGSNELVDLQARLKSRSDAALANGDTPLPAVPFLAGLAGWIGNSASTSTQFTAGPQVKDITNGMQVVPPPVQGNIAGFLSVLQARIRAACVLAGAPEYLGSGDASNNNLASIREAGSPFVVATEGRQQDQADAEVRVAETVVCYAGLDYPGLQVAVTPAPVAIRSDQEKAQTTAAKIAGGYMSKQQAIRDEGGDPERTMAEIAEWNNAIPDGGPSLPVPDFADQQ